MNNSLKIGIVAGLIAGIFASIILSIILVGFDLTGPQNPYAFSGLPLRFTSIIEIVIAEIILGVIWGILLGVIYSRFYDLIPGKKISKGLIFGLLYYSIYIIRTGMLILFYGFVLFAFSFFLIGFLPWIIYGLAIGILYEFMSNRYHVIKDKRLIKTHPIMSGFFPGTIAGCIYGVMAFSSNLLMGILGIWAWIPNYLADIEFLLNQLGTHVFFNLIWGGIFGMLFAFFYERIPDGKISKSLIFSMIIFSITSFRVGIYYLVYGSFPGFFGWVFFGFFAFIPYGLLLGYLYKPTK